jgi:hypothetical protein
MPFHIRHNGPAPISTYFLRRPCPPEIAQGPDELLSSFRGREVHGTPITLPSGYQGRILRTSAPTLAPARPARRTPIVRKRPAIEAAGSIAGPSGARRSPRKAKKAKMTFDLETPPSSPAGGTRSRPSSPIKAAAIAAFAAVMQADEPEAIAAQAAMGATDLLAAAKVEEDVAMLEDAPAPTEELKATIDLTPLQSFKSFMIWTPDGTPVDRGEDPYIRSLEEWVGLSHLVRRSSVRCACAERV